MASSFSFDASNFKSGKDLDMRVQRALYGVVKYWDGPVEAYMKHNAPWTDRTTNARNGLSATAQRSGSANTFAIVLSHSVDYGIYLELGTENMAARPIIMPTIRIYAPKVIKTLVKLLNRL